MDHAFEVGERYANRRGEYEVLDIAEKMMRIRYEDGEEMDTPIRIQKRIAQNMTIEKKIRKQKEIDRRKAKRRKVRRFGKEFDGLSEDDFQTSVVGTSWRARPNLGGRLARKLTELSGRAFVSYAVSRQMEVHVVQKDPYERRESDRKGRFAFGVDETHATYGFAIQRGAGYMDESWDWPFFLKPLSEDEALHEKLFNAMDRFGLTWRILEVDEDDEETLRYTLEKEGDNLSMTDVDSGETTTLDFYGLAAILDDLPEEKAYKVYLATRLDKEEAINLGEQLAAEVAPSWNAVLPLYMNSITRV